MSLTAPWPPLKKAKLAEENQTQNKEPARPYVEPMEQIFQVRKNVREGLKTDDGVVNDGIEHNIRDILAILAVNAEILDRCMGSRKQNENKHSGSVTFLRYSFDVVETYTISSTLNSLLIPNVQKSHLIRRLSPIFRLILMIFCSSSTRTNLFHCL